MTSKKAERLARFAAPDLYVVTCAPLSRGRSNDEVLEAVIAGGGRLIQLRDKEASPRAFYAMAQRFRERTRAAGVLLIINDHLDIALAVDADGVHLGQDDLPLEAARRLAPDLIIGRSTHSLEQALDAQAGGADYVNIGPIFATATKEHSAALGPEAIRTIAPHLHIPFTVMGGIKLDNIDEVVAAGARRVAVITAVTQADDMVAAVRALRARIPGAT
ncbi:MAG: thiamine phosphate synthase [bacterium]|nr:thiamine phosphate synthase [bacterium]